MNHSTIDQFRQFGFAVLEGAMTSHECDEFSAEFDLLLQSPPASPAGIRNLFQRCPVVCQLVRRKSIRSLVVPILGESAFAVRAILFDKSPDANWNVAWHQDTFIAVKKRFEVTGYEAWSEKNKVPHVKPPAAVLVNMLTLRLHLDSCDLDNGPLRVLAASHTKGILSTNDISQIVEESKEEVCIAGRGGCVLMSPLLVHASSRAINPTRRRVLHLEFANCKLPPPLQWHEQH